MHARQLPFIADYAKSGKSKCRKCFKPIEKGILRLGVMVQSRKHDGMIPKWYHFTCFFGRASPNSTTEISHIESLRWEDQERIREKIEAASGSSAGEEDTRKGKKRNNELNDVIPDIKDYVIDYAKSNRSKCKVCEENIPQGDLQILKKDYQSEGARQYDPLEKWHHVDCFLKVREELGFTASGSILPGFMALNPVDQELIKLKIPPLKTSNDNFESDVADGVSPSKKVKETTSLSKEASCPSKELLKKQNEKMFHFRDQLKILKKNELISLLDYNDQWLPHPQGESALLDHLSDIITFGALSKCQKCSRGQLIFKSGFGYQCIARVSEWSKCENIVEKPRRVHFKVPEDLKDSHPFLNDLKNETSDRLFIKASVGASASSSGDSSQKQSPVLHGLKFFLHKTKNKSANDVKKQVENLGGKVVKKYDSDVMAVISTEEELRKARLVKAIKSAKEDDIHVIADDFFDNINPTSSREEFIQLLDEKKISYWGSNASNRVLSAGKSVYPSTTEVNLKGGLAVDPESNLEDIAHVHKNGDDIYSVVLSLTDVQANKNSFYNLQVLEGDETNHPRYWLFRSWGRTGTENGGKKLEEYETLQDAIDAFKRDFQEKTGNMWEARRNFRKLRGRYMMIDVSYGDFEEGPRVPKPIKDLVRLIFDVEQMKNVMLAYELDLNKMPLGKLSRRQLQKAFGVLNDLQSLISRSADNTLIFDKTNQFYTLVPHNFGIAAPKILNTEQDIKDKITMLNDLMDIEIAYRLLKECDGACGNPIDNHYEKLNAKISVLQPDSDEFKNIQLYVKNTHAKTHSDYTLDIEHVFKVERKGEDARYKKFKNLENRKLLWHGSRLTNFAGILSQGLRIAPREAPSSGYMFGKGIYFADMVSKSANYCATTPFNNTGLVMLCEVALGNMLELTAARNIEQLPPGKDSVKGLGRNHPDPTEAILTPDGVEIPLGKGIKAPVDNTSLVYNEYIVYDVAQVKVQYLLRLKFNYTQDEFYNHK